MAIWETFATKIELLPHPNADRMQIGRVGKFQIVVGMGQYQNGDVIVFAPERAILPDSLKSEYVNSETGISYLAGSEHNRVKQVRLRGELSEGVTLSIDWVLAAVPEWNAVENIPLNVDISEKLGIYKYQPVIPYNMSGIINSFDSVNFGSRAAHHDVEQFRLFADEFVFGEEVICTCKIHGSQGNFYFSKTGEIGVTSKGMNERDQVIERSEKNLYWQALENSGLIDLVKCDLLEPESIDLKNFDVQFVGEVIPCQPGYSYGQDKPTIKLFRIRIDGRELSVDEIETTFGKSFIEKYWVPILYRGPFDPSVFEKLSGGMETVSGKSLHIREGIVITPAVPRVARRGFNLSLKFLNRKYKSSDEDLS